MAKKPPNNPTPSLFGDANVPPPVRPLPTSVQALFLPKLVEEAAQSSHMTAYADRRSVAHELFKKWGANFRSGQLSQLNESQLEQDFNNGLLGALGYQTSSQVASGDAWSLQAKWSFPNAGIADVALGRFETERTGKLSGQVVVVVELKGTRIDLDKHDPGAGRTPVQQAFVYLNASDAARWAIVSNYREFRLYSRDKGTNHVHRVLLDDLDNADAFARFFAVFHADSLLTEKSLILNAAELLRRTKDKQDKVGKTLYETYDTKRLDLIRILQGKKRVADLDTAIRTAQKLLDRILFIAFAEDRKLLDNSRLLEETFRMKAPMLTAWNNFQNLFRAFDGGDERSGITGFNGGLFAEDPILDDRAFKLDDSWPNLFQTLGNYDFRDEVSVEVLGHIFEKSITDLEKLRSMGVDAYQVLRESERGKKVGERKRQGVFYTHRAIVQYLVGAALDPSWDEHREALAAQHGIDLAVPGPHPAPFTRALLGRLDTLTVCDPACGSGAFLIAAYEWFEDHRMALLDELSAVEPDPPECAGGREDWRARSAASILTKNIYGVDLAAEAVEIARLSLWIQTARKDQKLSDLSHNVVEGNSVVDDPEVDPKAFNWHARFPEVFARGGFDAVIGNPPYVRQEWLGPIKSHLAERFQTYHGMADLYVYFYERGARVLKPGGRLAFVVTNKWMKAGYGEPLRKYFAEQAWIEQVIDFGHAKQFFPDADVFPCFLVVRRPNEGPKPEAARVCVIPREMVRLDDLPAQVRSHGIKVEFGRFGGEGWNLEPKAVGDLLVKLRECGMPLTEYSGEKPYRGVLTGFNEAFLIDSATKDALVKDDPKCSEIIKPYLRGQDIRRWSPEWAGKWMILLKSSSDFSWPWTGLGSESERIFEKTFLSIYKYMKRFENALKIRLDHGKNWWELRTCSYYDVFGKTKIVWQDLGFHSRFCLSESTAILEATCFTLASSDLWLLAVLNSSLMWAYLWRNTIHGKDEVLRLKTLYMINLPIANSDNVSRSETESCVRLLIEISRSRQSTSTGLADWLKVQFDIADPSMKLRDPIALDSDGFVAEVQKVRGKSKSLTSAGLKMLREEHARTIGPARLRAAEALLLERRVNDLVNEAYGLTPDEIRLMWDTAPPRMPIPRPDFPAEP
jgi:type I restriction-modification system DNA methylase subunit